MSEAKYHWLIAGNVIASAGRGNVGQKGLNTLIKTAKPFFGRADLATAQQGLMRRFLDETPQEKGSKIHDVFVLSVNNLGLMTDEEFNAGFQEDAPVDPSQVKH